MGGTRHELSHTEDQSTAPFHKNRLISEIFCLIVNFEVKKNHQSLKSGNKIANNMYHKFRLNTMQRVNWNYENRMCRLAKPKSTKAIH